MKVASYNLEMDAFRHPMMVADREYETDLCNLQSPEDVDWFCRHTLRLDRMCEEYMYMICLNNKGNVVGIFSLSHGSVRNSICNPREVLMRALLCGATTFTLVHNHPSGDTEPSREDYEVCQRVKQAGEIMGIRMVDFMIVGSDYYSFCAQREI